MGVIINNWGHIITFWGRGFIGGDYHYLGARLLATSIIGWRDTLTRCFQNPGIAEKKGLVVTHVKIFFGEFDQMLIDQPKVITFPKGDHSPSTCKKMPRNRFDPPKYVNLCPFY